MISLLSPSKLPRLFFYFLEHASVPNLISRLTAMKTRRVSCVFGMIMYVYYSIKNVFEKYRPIYALLYIYKGHERRRLCSIHVHEYYCYVFYIVFPLRTSCRKGPFRRRRSNLFVPQPRVHFSETRAHRLDRVAHTLDILQGPDAGRFLKDPTQ